MADIDKILSAAGDGKLNEEDLVNYVQNNLPEEQKHEIEKMSIDSAFLDDALEGLKQIDRKEHLDQYVLQLNRNLQKQLGGKKQRRQNKRLKDNQWIIIAVAVLLAICIIGYAIIHLNVFNG